MRAEKLDKAQKGKIAVLVIIMFLVLVFLYSKYYFKSLLNHFIVTKGIVTKASVAAKVGGYINYTFWVNGELYSGWGSLPNLKDVDDKFIIVNRIFPVIVDTTSVSYSNSKMLFDSLSFVQYGLQYPDSLSWLKKYLK
jgi:hypothetical protein